MNEITKKKPSRYLRIIFFLNRKFFPVKEFKSSKYYWEDRYRKGGNSGPGSYNKLAEFKGEIINFFINRNNIYHAIEFGCGDGNQIQYFNLKSYIGYDVSQTAIKKCRSIFRKDKSKKFILMKDFHEIKAELCLSLDVIYHLIEDDVYHDYMSKLFDSSEKFVIIYSSNKDGYENKEIANHIKHREFTKWILKNAPNFHLIDFIPNKFKFNGDPFTTSFADFYFFEKKSS